MQERGKVPRQELVSTPHGGLATVAMCHSQVAVSEVSTPHGGLATCPQPASLTLLQVSTPHGGLATQQEGLRPAGEKSVSTPHGGLATRRWSNDSKAKNLFQLHTVD